MIWVKSILGFGLKSSKIHIKYNNISRLKLSAMRKIQVSVTSSRTICSSFILKSGEKRGDLSSKPHLREYPQHPLIDDSIFTDEDYENLIHNEMDSVFEDLGEAGKVAVIQPWIKWGPKMRRDTTKELLLEESCALLNTLTISPIVFKVRFLFIFM